MTNTKKNQELPIPAYFDANKVGEVWRVPYHERAILARTWAKEYNITPAAEDKTRVCLLIIDAQNTFCLPDFELFVAGKSGKGAIEDNVRLCEFIYRNLGVITTIAPTMDTHTAMQIFHPMFWINVAGEHPAPATVISLDDLKTGVWQVNPAVAYYVVNNNYDKLQKYAFYYVEKLSADSKYPLTIWPYHSMLGGIGHALVPAVEEAVFFHSHVRFSKTIFELKGNNPLTENYSVLRAEVLEDTNGQPIAQKNDNLIKQLLEFDAVIIAGQAKSHCVAWTIDDLLTEINAKDRKLAEKVYLLTDCTSPVVIPGVVDFTEQADAAFQKFANSGMHIVKSSDTIANWLDL